MSSVFSKVINGEIPSYKIAENNRFAAFLDAFPLKRGHTLVVPKKEIDSVFDLESDDYKELMLFAKNIAIAIKKAIPCNRIALSVVGLEVSHAHIHLVPINTTNDINFSNEKLKLSMDEFNDIANSIKKCL